MLNYIRSLPIRRQLFLIIMAFMLLLFGVMATAYIFTSRWLYHQNSDYSYLLLNKIRQHISAQNTATNRLIQGMAYNESVQQYLLETKDQSPGRYELYRQTDTLVARYSSLREGIMDVTIIGNNGSNFNLMIDSQKREAVMRTIEEMAFKNYSGSNPYYKGLIVNHNGDKENQYFLVGLPINNAMPTSTVGRRLGYMVVFMKPSSFISNMEEVYQNAFGKIYVLDRNNVVVAASGGGHIGETYALDRLEKAGSGNYVFYDEQHIRHIVRMVDLPDIGGKIINVISEKELLRGMTDIRKVYMFILALTVPALIFMAIVFGKNIVSPIRMFIRSINALKMGHFQKERSEIKLDGYLEIKIMAGKFNEMIEAIDDLTEEAVASRMRIYELELSKQSAELSYLKHQVNPHFLYNTLASMKGLAAELGMPQFVEITGALSQIYKYSIKGAERVTLREELDIVKFYVKIQQFRFEDRFDVYYDVDPQLHDRKIIKMILQPIVENALSHGLERKMDKGTLWIGGCDNGQGALVLWVKDDGEGIPPDQLARLQQALSGHAERETAAADNHSLGLMNVHRRLQLSYGSGSGVAIRSSPTAGTEVYLTILAKEGEDG
ncbi:sensor histidine kinase [Paenibacillus sp. SAF-054]|uniref:sensor histidine kinase n=1 Tax=unclassified Paenibacillus TaxID=185978 RepID=UPI003F8143CF